MSNVGTVTFDIAAESAKLRSELDKVRKDVSGLKSTGEKMATGLQRSMSGVEAAFGAAGLTFGIAAVGAGLVNATKAAIDYGDAIGKASTKAGIGAMEFQALAYAARTVDVDMNAVSTSLRVMQTNLSEAAAGNKAAAATLGALGLEARALRELAPEQQFEAIADQISKFHDPADRARAATEMFGRAGAELLPMFEQGAAGIKAAREEAQKLGLISTPEQLEALQHADDAIKKLEERFSALARTLTASVVPGLAEFFDDLRVGLGGGSRLEELTKQLEYLKGHVEGGVFAGMPDIKSGVLLPSDIQSEIQRLEGLKRFEAQRISQELARKGAAAGSGNAPPGFGSGAGAAAGATGGSAIDQWAAGRETPGSMRNVTQQGITNSVARDFDAQIQQDLNAAELEMLTAHLDAKLVLQDDYNRAVVEGTQFRESSIMDIFQASEEQKYIMQAASANDTGALAEMGYGLALDAMGRHSKAGKAMGIAQATVSTLVATVNTLKDVPYPLNFAAAAMVLASGMKTISRIKGVDPMTGGGGGVGGSVGSAGSLGGSSSGASGPSAGSLSEVQPDVKARPMVQLVVHGDIHSGKETADWLIDQITTRVRDSDAVIIPVGSRQAQELAGVGGGG